MNYICQKCGKIYQIDLMILDEKWELITKDTGFNLLCSSCIMELLETITHPIAIKQMIIPINRFNKVFTTFITSIVEFLPFQ